MKKCRRCLRDITGSGPEVRFCDVCTDKLLDSNKAVGLCFKHKGMILRVVDDAGVDFGQDTACDFCVFNSHPDCIPYDCDDYLRIDNKNIHFEKVDDAESLYAITARAHAVAAQVPLRMYYPDQNKDLTPQQKEDTSAWNAFRESIDGS